MAQGVKIHTESGIDILDLKTFVTCCETKDSYEAADRMNVSQPAIVYRIQNMEHYFKGSLLYRRCKPPRYTPQGKVIYEYAMKIVALYDELVVISQERK